MGTSTQAQLIFDTTCKVVEYAGRNLKEAQDIRNTINNLTELSLTKPVKEKSGDVDKIAAIYKIELGNYFKRKKKITEIQGNHVLNHTGTMYGCNAC